MLTETDTTILQESLPFWDQLNGNQKELLKSGSSLMKYAKNSNVHSDNSQCVGTVSYTHLDVYKGQAPSGTSREMGEIMAHALGKELKDVAVYGREGVSPREPGTIGYHSLRAGNIPSSNTVFFGGMGERLEITHHSYNWECFARGACDCAAFLADKEPGFYTIKDVLNL